MEDVEFSALSTDGTKARCGVMKTQSGELLTPACLWYSRKGALPFITHDLMRETLPECRALQLTWTDLYEHSEAIKHSPGGGGVHSFFHLGLPMYLAVRDPSRLEDTPAAANEIPANTAMGKVKVTLDKFMEVVEEALRPDFYASFSHELSRQSPKKAAKRQVDRHLQWLDACLQWQSDRKITARKVFGVVVGHSLAQRQHSAKETAKRSARLAGFVIGELGLDEPPEERGPLIDVTIANLPASHPRLVTGLGSPEEVLDCVERGVDLFVGVYPHVLSSGGYGLVFPLDRSAPAREDGDGDGDQSKINLRDRRYQLDARPIVEGCGCFACKRHTRAYIQHLLLTHEMLGDTLLAIHNTYHYGEFLARIRQAIKHGQFREYKEWFTAVRRPCGITNRSSSHADSTKV